ncbi:galectin-3-like [Mercenaria mercenaria]|uniref:galectin-3-like n=1 Tax=Mercenaria mercenaria TaxID=6596 RepID=UPI00234F9267|nr:galectin-3-like [Mercenaria mercenaria]
MSVNYGGEMGGAKCHGDDIGKIAGGVCKFAGAMLNELQPQQQPGVAAASGLCKFTETMLNGQQPQSQPCNGGMSSRPGYRQVPACPTATCHGGASSKPGANRVKCRGGTPSTPVSGKAHAHSTGSHHRAASGKQGASRVPANNPATCHGGWSGKEGARKVPCHGGASSTRDTCKVTKCLAVIPVPFVQQTGFLRHGKTIMICGAPHQDARRFTVYLQHGKHHEPPLIAMSVDARFTFGSDRNCLARNHKQDTWGQTERRISYFPFRPNVKFEMIILVERDCFKVAVNNKHMFEFKHRVQPLNRIDTLRIEGDVRLTEVQIQG